MTGCASVVPGSVCQLPSFPGRGQGNRLISRHLACVGLLALLVVTLFVSPVQADSLPPARQREILRDALQAYDQAVAIARQDPTQAADLYRQSAGGFQALRDAGLCNAGLEYNLGNVYFRLGDVGRAIVHYRRAVALDPGDERLAANLRYARDRVEPRITASGETRLARQILFWHYNTSATGRFWALSLLSILGWPLLFAGVHWRKRTLWIPGALAAAFALAAAASLSWQIHDEGVRPPAVVVAETHLRLGRGEGSDLALKQPLGRGVELRILQQVGDWAEVRLPNDQTGWVQAGALERV